MKKDIKKAYQFLAMMLVVILGGCSDDPTPDDNTGEVRKEGNETISCFTLNKTAFRIPDKVVEVTTRLVSVNQEKTNGVAAKSDTINLPAKITVDDSRIHVEMRIPDDVVLDKEYLLTLHRAPGARRYVGGVKATFKANRLCCVGAEAEPYRGLEGEGTEESPYLIGSTEDFMSFLNNLRRDEMFHGAELCFLQTADFDAPTQSDILDGRGYYGFEFAGSYDGDNHVIDNLYYHGAQDSEKDANIGLFPIVSGDAVIKNLTLSNVNILEAHSKTGALIGSLTGDGIVTISNVNVSGSIDCKESGGGLIGYGSGALIIDGCDIEVNVEGSQKCGGVIGEFYGYRLEVYDVTTKSHRFSVKATNEYAGGIAGYVLSQYLIFENIKLEHTVSSEDSDLKIIQSLGDYSGGLAGALLINVWGSAKLEDIDIICPISASDEYVGGLAGYCEMKSNASMTRCRVKAVVSGGHKVGGWFGQISSNNSVILEFDGGDDANSYEADINAACVVSTHENCGGLFGYLDKAPKMQGDRIKVFANVDGNNVVGGVIGYMKDSSIDASLFNLNSTMYVEGVVYVGGLVGKSEYGAITDSRNPVFDVERTPQAYIPSKSQFTPSTNCRVEGKFFVGGIVGMSESFLYCLSSTATVKSTGVLQSFADASYTGGIAGYAGIFDDSPIQRCVFMGTVTANGSFVGGIAGFLRNSVPEKEPGGFLRDCVNYGAIKGGNFTGGIVGWVEYFAGVRMELHWSVNLGRIDGGVSCGGLIGICLGDDAGMGMVGLANYGDVYSTGSDDVNGVGGIIGNAGSTNIDINGAMNKGNIHAEGHIQAIGGVVGVLGNDPGGVCQRDNGEMYWSANYGNISCSNPETQVGGVCGWLEEGYSGGYDSYIHECYNIGQVTSNHNSDTGGILGYADYYARVERCINFGTVSYGNAMIGTEKWGAITYHSGLNMIADTGKDWCADRKVYNPGNESEYEGIYFDNVNWKMTDGRPHLASNRFEGVTPPTD